MIEVVLHSELDKIYMRISFTTVGCHGFIFFSVSVLRTNMATRMPCGPPDYGFVFPSGFINTDEKTFEFDEALPSLPIPTLEHTLTKYMESGQIGRLL